MAKRKGKGKGWINYWGYKEIIKNNKIIPEHRYIWLRDNDWGMWFIPKGWVIHHRNMNKLDNRIENLICIPLECHISVHKKEGI